MPKIFFLNELKMMLSFVFCHFTMVSLPQKNAGATFSRKLFQKLVTPFSQFRLEQQISSGDIVVLSVCKQIRLDRRVLPKSSVTEREGRHPGCRVLQPGLAA